MTASVNYIEKLVALSNALDDVSRSVPMVPCGVGICETDTETHDEVNHIRYLVLKLFEKESGKGFTG